MIGSLVLRATVHAGRTVLVESRASYPLQVVRPQIAPADGSLSVVMLLLSGGLLDGDQVSVEVVVEPRASLSLRTQAATQVHAGRSRQSLRVSVGEGASFRYIPHAVVPHAAADFYSKTEIEMQPEARVVIADVLSPGRVQHGEQFAYRQVRLHLDVSERGRLLARERAAITPDPCLRAAQYGPWSHAGGMYLLGPGEPPCVEACADAQLGSTELANGGWYVRALANRAVVLDAGLHRIADSWWRSASGSIVRPA